MNHSNLLRRLLGGFLATAAIAVITFSGCTKIDNSLGGDLTLDNQVLKYGAMDFSGLTSGGGNYFSSRLYRTDSINSAGLGYGYLGTMGNDTFGMRQASFYSQYLCLNSLDDDVFGYMPIYDSMTFYFSLSGYGGDTSLVQQFEVYEVIDNSFITESTDSIFFVDIDMSPFLNPDPIYTFTYPDQDNEIYVSTATYVKLEDTPQTEAFVNRLLFKTIDGDYDYEIHSDDEEWVEQFKGIYIRPVEPISPASGTTGAIYAFSLSSSGMTLYGRSREEDDPTVILDTIGMTYSFYVSSADDGNISINKIEHNYDGSLINEADVKTPTNLDVPETSVLRIEGMAGVVSEITIAKEFFEQLDTILEAEEAATGEIYNSIFFNQAKLSIYMQEVNGYDPNNINPFDVVEWMDYMPTNLGLYTDYSSYLLEYEDYEDVYYTTLTGVDDYLYAYESSYTLDFGGALNRSQGCYIMYITSYIQSIWSEYVEAKEEAEENGTELDWDAVSDRVMYLGPTGTGMFSMQYASLQAGDPLLNSAPMTLELTYTMIR